MDDKGWNGSGVYNPTQHNAAHESATPVNPQIGSANVATTTAITDNNVLNTPQSPRRVNQQQVLPNAIKSRLMEPVSDTGPVLLSTSAVVPDGFSVIVTTTTTSNSGGLILSEIFWAIYIDNVSIDNLVPTGGNVSTLQYPFYTWNPVIDELGVSLSTQPGKTISAVQVRNEIGDGTDHIIIVQSYVRVIINGSGQNTG